MDDIRIDFNDVENIINLLDNRMEAGANRINLHVDDSVTSGETREVYHHGRCDVGSAWALGTATNFGGSDMESCN